MGSEEKKSLIFNGGFSETNQEQSAWKGGFSETNQEQNIWSGGFSSEEKKQDLSEIKKFSHRERQTSIKTYTCAIESYESASYDYESGGPVTYTINLSVLNYNTVLR